MKHPKVNGSQLIIRSSQVCWDASLKIFARFPVSFFQRSPDISLIFAEPVPTPWSIHENHMIPLKSHGNPIERPLKSHETTIFLPHDTIFSPFFPSFFHPKRTAQNAQRTARGEPRNAKCQECEPCPSGSYAAERGSTACESCSDELVALSKGSDGWMVLDFDGVSMEVSWDMNGGFMEVFHGILMGHY